MKKIFVFLLIVFSLTLTLSLFAHYENNEQTGSSVKGLTMACLGDSITLGARVDEPYPVLLKDELDLGHCLNYGISGSTIAYSTKSPMSVRFSELPKELDILFVMGGTNDYWSNVPLGLYSDTSTTTFYGAMNHLVKRLKKKYPDTFIFFATPYQMQSPTGENTAGFVLEDYVNVILNVCYQEKIPVLDFYHNGQHIVKNQTHHRPSIYVIAEHLTLLILLTTRHKKQ